MYSLILKTVLLKNIWLNTSFYCNLNFDKIYALFGVNFILLKSCWCKVLDIWKVCIKLFLLIQTLFFFDFRTFHGVWANCWCLIVFSTVRYRYTTELYQINHSKFSRTVHLPTLQWYTIVLNKALLYVFIQYTHTYTTVQCITGPCCMGSGGFKRG